MTEVLRPQAVILHTWLKSDRTLTRQLEEATFQAGWEPLTLDTPFDAHLAQLAGAKALISAYGYDPNYQIPQADDPTLLVTSEVLGVPRALFTTEYGPQGRPDVPDLILPPLQQKDVTPKIARWLGSIGSHSPNRPPENHLRLPVKSINVLAKLPDGPIVVTVPVRHPQTRAMQFARDAIQEDFGLESEASHPYQTFHFMFDEYHTPLATTAANFDNTDGTRLNTSAVIIEGAGIFYPAPTRTNGLSPREARIMQRMRKRTDLAAHFAVRVTSLSRQGSELRKFSFMDINPVKL